MELEEAVTRLHSEIHLHIETSRTHRGRIRYIATLQGTDWLDGDWSTQRIGTASTITDALKKAIGEFTTSKRRRWWLMWR